MTHTNKVQRIKFQGEIIQLYPSKKSISPFQSRLQALGVASLIRCGECMERIFILNSFCQQIRPQDLADDETVIKLLLE